MRAAALRYRVMAYITGVLIIVVCFVGIPLQIVAHNTVISNEVATVHGFLYIVYVICAYILARKLKMKLGPTTEYIAAQPEVAFAGATTGPTNLLVSVVCTDTGHLYRYLTTQIGELAGIRHIETAPTIRTLKRAGSAGAA